MSEEAIPAQEEISPGLRGFAQKVSRYFLDFLETDFKRQAAPRRKIQTKSDTGFRVGVPLRKYATLNSVIWKLVSEPTSDGFTLRIPKGRYTAPISPTLRNLIAQQIDTLDKQPFELVRAQTIEFATRKRGSAVEHPEKYVEDVQTEFADLVNQKIIAPVLALLDGPFRQQAYSAVDSVYELESELGDVLSAPVLAQLPTALNTYIVSGNLALAETILREIFSEDESKQRLKDFFESFATSDAYQEVRDLLNYARTGENLQFYLYLCEIRFGNSTYPLFYLPATITLDEKNADFILEFDPHLYVNKRAIDYICQEQHSTSARIALSPIEERIIYLSEQDTLLAVMSKVLVKMTPAFDLNGMLDLTRRELQTADSATLRMRNTSYFAVFDRSDESLLNDYEELLTMLHDDESKVNALFLNIIDGFLEKDPVSVKQDVTDAWSHLPMVGRLIAETPIPVNEEQRKIMIAINDPKCRYVVVQGPPGTGKSHTITALAFDCIIKGKNILVLSDKQEALDVVQDKLKQALQSVRLGDEFPDPILRLGKTASTYSKLISSSSTERIQNHHLAAKSHNGRLKEDIEDRVKELAKLIQTTVDCYTSVNINDVERLHELEDLIETRHKEFLPGLRNLKEPSLAPEIKTCVDSLPEATLRHTAVLFKDTGAKSLANLLLMLKYRMAAASLRNSIGNVEPLCLFSELCPTNQSALQGFIAEYDGLRWPIFGYLFTGAKARALNARLGQELGCINTIDLHKKTAELREVSAALHKLYNALDEAGIDDDPKMGKVVYRLLLKEPDKVDLRPMLDFVGMYLRFFHIDPQFPLTPEEIPYLVDHVRYALLWKTVNNALNSVPAMDYVGSMTDLEQLYTSRLAHEIDGRFLNFVNNHRATAKSLGAVIKARQKFPKDSFDNLKNAFPCIISGIRDFAEYVPLKEEMFDLVVIDEGSQVSVAQAFPALLRARKVVVFGDQKQFNNVKSANASNELNQRYLTGLEQHFRENISTASDKIQRLKQFDVKKSVLEFFDLIANYTDMLRKHFRGYQELISFSSKTFYGGQLQAIKVRGKPIEDVIKFTVLENDGRAEKFRNTNTQEADFMLQELREMIDDESTDTVGIITPFREQQQLLTKLLFSDSYAAKFESDLHLKIMTFDSCQGDERDIIFFSMVATPLHDALNYVFPITLTEAEDVIEEKLRMQRLNVGFSRSKECMHFVLSKPIDQFRGTIGRVLNHYQNILNDRSMPEAEDTDRSSPMEAKVLDWLSKTAFFQKNESRIELIAQFPVGEYLRQLDPYYKQPAYRCDFLLRYHGEEKTVNVIIEYDGFLEHFHSRNKVHAGNWDRFYKAEDIERQLTLESYGYNFIRLNRFNLGNDPVAVLSERLYALVKMASNDEDAQMVTDIRTKVGELENGTSKPCKKCGDVLAKEAFWDPKLKNGAGSYGQICMSCKSSSRPVSSNIRRRYFGRKYR